MKHILKYSIFENLPAANNLPADQDDYLLVHLNGDVYFKVEEILAKIQSKEIFKYPELSQGRMTMMDPKRFQHSFLYHSLGELITYVKDVNGWFSAEWKRKIGGEDYNGKIDVIFYDEFLFLVAEDLVRFDSYKCLTDEDIWRNAGASIAKETPKHPELQALYDCKNKAQLQQVYRKLVMEFHPDRAGDNDLIKYITVAYFELKKKLKR